MDFGETKSGHGSTIALPAPTVVLPVMQSVANLWRYLPLHPVTFLVFLPAAARTRIVTADFLICSPRLKGWRPVPAAASCSGNHEIGFGRIGV